MPPEADTPTPQPRRRLSDAELGHLWRVRYVFPDSAKTHEAIFSRRGSMMKFVWSKIDVGCTVTIDRAPKPAEFAAKTLPADADDAAA